MFRPKMGVGASVDQLCAHAHATAGPLYAALHNMSDSEDLRDVAEIACRCGLERHDRRATDHFQIRDLGQVGQNFVLYAISKISVLLLVPYTFKWQYHDAFRPNRT